MNEDNATNERRITEKESWTLMKNYKVLEHTCAEEFMVLARHCRIDLLEVPTRPGSNLGEAALQQGGSAERLGAHNGFDLSRAASSRKR